MAAWGLSATVAGLAALAPSASAETVLKTWSFDRGADGWTLDRADCTGGTPTGDWDRSQGFPAAGSFRLADTILVALDHACTVTVVSDRYLLTTTDPLRLYTTFKWTISNLLPTSSSELAPGLEVVFFDAADQVSGVSEAGDLGNLTTSSWLGTARTLDLPQSYTRLQVRATVNYVPDSLVSLLARLQLNLDTVQLVSL